MNYGEGWIWIQFPFLSFPPFPRPNGKFPQETHIVDRRSPKANAFGVKMRQSVCRIDIMSNADLFKKHLELISKNNSYGMCKSFKYQKL
jgi:hypothetical protein